MTTAFEAAVTLIEHLSPVEQARLVALLAERLQHSLQPEPSPAPTDEPAFWHTPIEDDTQLSIEAPDGAATQAMVARWFGALLPEEDALDLAMSASIAEWNLDA
ncbi:hypothetical protein [Roseiflexus sp.]|uniref:hypothetical protein n=1 Tax=Roseiflexus sp. TaxID=2562120 RepID=UPI00398B51C0